MFTPGNVILGLKIGVSAVTVLLIASGTAIALGRVRLHGRINIVFFILTTLTVVGFEFIIRFVNPQLTDSFSRGSKTGPAHSPVVFGALRHHAAIHALDNTKSPQTPRPTGHSLCMLWTGTFITGVFFLPC